MIVDTCTKDCRPTGVLSTGTWKLPTTSESVISSPNLCPQIAITYPGMKLWQFAQLGSGNHGHSSAVNGGTWLQVFSLYSGRQSAIQSAIYLASMLCCSGVIDVWSFISQLRNR